MKLAVVMDPIESIHPKKDTTLALMLAAQKKHWHVFTIETKDLFLKNEKAFAFAKTIKVKDSTTKWLEIKNEKNFPLDFFDVILMRKDPPVDKAYWHATQILDFAEKDGVLVLNKPQSLRDYNEKLAIHYFSSLCVPTLVSHHHDHIIEFILEQKHVILKSLDDMGGKNIFKVSRQDSNLNVILENLTAGNRHIVCQHYIPQIKKGDKRIILINGEPLPFALLRIPKKGETRGNLARGGIPKGVRLSKNDYHICNIVGPFLREKGLFLVGLDVIGKYLTEINITSPTCVRELEAIFKVDIAGKIIDEIDNLFHLSPCGRGRSA